MLKHDGVVLGLGMSRFNLNIRQLHCYSCLAMGDNCKSVLYSPPSVTPGAGATEVWLPAPLKKAVPSSIFVVVCWIPVPNERHFQTDNGVVLVIWVRFEIVHRHEIWMFQHVGVVLVLGMSRLKMSIGLFHCYSCLAMGAYCRPVSYSPPGVSPGAGAAEVWLVAPLKKVVPSFIFAVVCWIPVPKMTGVSRRTMES